MNTFTARKLGEVVAFLQLNIDTHTRAKDALLTVVSAGEHQSVIDSHAGLIAALHEVADTQGMRSAVDEKAEVTKQKLSGMRDTYIGDQWENPTEIYEWQSFADGAGSAHAALVRGAAEATNNQELAAHVARAFDLFHEQLQGVQQHLNAIGRKRGAA